MRTLIKKQTPKFTMGEDVFIELKNGGIKEYTIIAITAMSIYYDNNIKAIVCKGFAYKLRGDGTAITIDEDRIYNSKEFLHRAMVERKQAKINKLQEEVNILLSKQ